MVSSAVDKRPVKMLSAADDHAVLCFLYICPHGGKIADHGLDSIGFFDLQLCGVTDYGLAFCKACHSSNDRKLVDQGGDQGALDDRSMKAAAFYQNIGSRFSGFQVFIEQGQVSAHVPADL